MVRNSCTAISQVADAFLSVFAVCGMALFGDVPNHAGPLDQQYTFSTFPQAVLQLFQLTVGNNWNSVMYPNLEDKSRWALQL